VRQSVFMEVGWGNEEWQRINKFSPGSAVSSQLAEPGITIRPGKNGR
jgi:hypothetical protein